MSSVIIAVVVVLGIIVAGGFLLYFLGDLLMSISGKKKDSDAIREKQLKEQKELEARVDALENSQEAKKDPAIATVLFNGGTVEAYDPNEDEEEVTTQEAPETAETTEESSEEVSETEEAEETTESEEEEDSTTEYIRQRRKELLERLAKMQEEKAAEAEAEESEGIVDLSEETTEEETTVTEETEEVTEEAPETAETTEEASEEETEETETVEETDETVDSEDTATEEVAARVETETVEQIQTTDGLGAFSLEELEAKLAEEQEKLKNNEKELRKCKKEFIPLRRVKNTLESDEKKLRRKEALVAKQKVVLYGVNNYSDIDEEKAQKLAEDLDLLDGLKLSVQHCQEVMDKNQDRYPLLEQIFNLLSSQNDQIKGNIQEIQDAIAKLKGETDAE